LIFQIIGNLVFDPTKPKIESLRQVIEGKRFEKMNLGVAVRFVEGQTSLPHNAE
jgi:hypothetical protein